MKKFRFLVLAMLLVLSMALFTGCSKVKEPTLEEVEEALRDEGYLPEDEEDSDKDDEDADKDEESSDEESTEDESAEEESKKEDKVEWSVTIDKNKLNDDKDKATVDCTLTVKDGSMETTTEFEVEFKLRDDKTWKCRDVEQGDSETKLVEGISDDLATKLLEETSFSIDAEDAYLYSEDVTSITLGEHENDLENMQDVVTVTVTGESGVRMFEFDVKVTFYYDQYDEWGDGWYISNKEVLDGAKVDYAEGYQLDASPENVIKMITAEDAYESVYFLGTYYDFYSEDVEITDMEVGDYELDGSSWIEIPCSWTVKSGDVTLEMEADLEFYFDGESWAYDWMYNDVVTSWSSDIIGTWKGVDEDYGNVTIEIPNELNEDGDLFATVTIATAENGTYSYYADVYDYYAADGSIDLYFEEWITMPKDGDEYAYVNYDGTIVDGVWTGSYSWDNYEFTKSDASAPDEPVDEEPTVDEPVEDESAEDAPVDEEAAVEEEATEE